MSQLFRDYLKKIGSGVHTGKHLSREESAQAMAMMLEQEATPAQIGAFLIAHRIKRPTAPELAGILDAFDQLGPKLGSIVTPDHKTVIVMGHPYDGRSRTVPVAPVTALILATAGVPVLHHGGDRMPTKYGVPLVDFWQALELPFTQLSLVQNQSLLQESGLAFVYLPNHFPLALPLVDYREQLGKRPPIASAELIWTPYQGAVDLVTGYVHPPSEERFQETLTLRGQTRLTTVKGLEGSCDLPLSRTTIIGTGQGNLLEDWERILIHPANYNLSTHDLPLNSFEQAVIEMKAAIAGKASLLRDAVLLNGGFYLWHCGVVCDLAAGLALTEELLCQGKVAQKLAEIRENAIAKLSTAEELGSEES